MLFDRKYKTSINLITSETHRCLKNWHRNLNHCWFLILINARQNIPWHSLET